MNGAVYSMTGFATGTLTHQNQLSQQIFTLDIRSVNSRFLDLSFKLPDSYRHLEPKLRDLLARRLKRGKCEVRLSYQYSVSDASPAAIEPSLLESVLAKQTQILAIAPNAAPLSVSQLLELASSRTTNSQEITCPDVDLLTLAQTTLHNFIQARATEGAKLAAVMLAQIQNLRGHHAAVVPLIPALIEQQRQKFLQKFAEAVADSGGKITPSVAEERALVEATAFALRIDVTEEVNRLSSHLTEIESLLTTGATKSELGKRLEFLIQELQREANTLGSKSASLDTTKIAVEMKVLIEQLREQVQNIE